MADVALVNCTVCKLMINYDDLVQEKECSSTTNKILNNL